MKFDNDYWHVLDKKTATRVDVNPRYIGRSANPTIDQVEALKTRIFQGATHVELGFFGKGKGSKAQGHATPETYGKEQREALRHMAKVNKIDLSVHAAPDAGSFSGMTERGFDDGAQASTLQEVKRSVDFAAEVTQGGPIVVHLQGESPMAVSDREGFETHEKEKESAPIYLANSETGEVKGLRRDIKVSTFDGYDDKGDMIFKEKTYNEFEDEFNKLPKEKKDQYGNAAKYFYSTFMEKELDVIKGEGNRFAHEARKANKILDALEEKKELYEKHLKESGNIEASKRILLKDLMDEGIMPKIKDQEMIGELLEDPSKFLNNVIDDHKREKEYAESIAIGKGMTAKSIEQDIRNLKPLEEVGKERTAAGLAKAAMYAYEKEKKMNLKKPLFIAPENIFPEMGYGAHPQELKEAVLKAREYMEKDLVTQKGFTKEKAKQVAQDHIKATFDVGHANTWKKYYKGKEEDFNKWLKKEVEDLNKQKIIGHVHLSDNFGYYDEELPVGEGSAPVKEFVQQMRESGYKGKMVVESPEDQALYPAWKHLNSPMYRMEGVTNTWTDIQGSYFGKTASPTYIVGENVRPSEDWTLWSGTPLE